jgi:hypothetical protein
MKNRLLVALAAFIIATQCFAGGDFQKMIDRIGSVFENASSYEQDASAWHDPSAGGTYYSAPRGGFRFKSSVVGMPAFASIRPPSFEAGCGGFSYDLGMMSIIDTDQLEAMIADAGAAAAWGVLLVLKNAMPSIAATFEELNKWMAEIQNFMGDMCNKMNAIANNKLGGRNLGENFATNALSAFGKNDEGSMAKWLRDGREGLKKGVDDWINDAGDGAEGNKSAAVGSSVISQIANSIKGATVSLASLDYNDAPCGILKTDLRTLLEGKEIGKKNILNNNLSADEIASIRASLLLFGDFVIAKDGSQALTKIFAPATSKLTASDVCYSPDPKKVGEALKTYLNDSGDTLPVITFTFEKSPVATASLADFLLYGAEKNGTAECGAGGVCKVKNYTILYTNTPYTLQRNTKGEANLSVGSAVADAGSSSGNYRLSAFTVDGVKKVKGTGGAKEDDMVEIEWPGVIPASKTLVACLVDGIKSSSDSWLSCGEGTIFGSVWKSQDFIRKASAIALLEMADVNGSSSGKPLMQLRDLVAYDFTYDYVTALIDSFEVLYGGYLNKTSGVTMGKEASEAFLQQLEQTRVVRKAISDYILSVHSDRDAKRMTDEAFSEIYKKFEDQIKKRSEKDSTVKEEGNTGK